MARIRVRYIAGINFDITEVRWLDTVTGDLYRTKDASCPCTPLEHRPVPGEAGIWRTLSGSSTVCEADVAIQPTPDPKMNVASSKPTADATLVGRKIGKVRMDLVMQDMPRAIESLARVMTWALEEKGYKESDWLHVPNGEQVYSAGLHRHDNKEKRGQEFDDESGLEHAIHTAWNAMARVELILRRKEQAK